MKNQKVVLSTMKLQINIQWSTSQWHHRDSNKCRLFIWWMHSKPWRWYTRNKRDNTVPNKIKSIVGTFHLFIFSIMDDADVSFVFKLLAIFEKINMRNFSLSLKREFEVACEVQSTQSAYFMPFSISTIYSFSSTLSSKSLDFLSCNLYFWKVWVCNSRWSSMKYQADWWISGVSKVLFSSIPFIKLQ